MTTTTNNAFDNALDNAMNKLAVASMQRGEWHKVHWLFQEAPQAPKYKRIAPGVVTTADEDGEVYVVIRNDGQAHRADGALYAFIDHDVRDAKGCLHAREETQFNGVEQVRWNFVEQHTQDLWGDKHKHNHADDREYHEQYPWTKE